MKERTDDRTPVKIVGSYRVGRGTKRSVTMLDISETGAKFHDHRTILAQEANITMRVGTLGPFDAVVRWVDSDAIGVQFAHRIYGPVFEHIRDTLSSK